MAIITKNKFGGADSADGYVNILGLLTPTTGGTQIAVGFLKNNLAYPPSDDALKNYTFANQDTTYTATGTYPSGSLVYGILFSAPADATTYSITQKIKDNVSGSIQTVTINIANRETAFVEFTVTADTNGKPNFTLMGNNPGDFWVASAVLLSDTYINMHVTQAAQKKKVIKCVGDSTTEGVVANVNNVPQGNSLNSYPHRLALEFGLTVANSWKKAFQNYVVPEGQYLPTNADYNANKLITIQNFGRGGDRLDQIIARFTPDVMSDYDDFDEIQINFFGYLNDIFQNTLTPKQAYDKYVEYAALCAAHSKITLRVYTVPLTSDATINVKIKQLNAFLRADNSFAQFFVDLERNVKFVDGTGLDTDGGHYLPALNTKLAHLVKLSYDGTLNYPVISTMALPNALLGTAYNYTLTATGATSWQFKSGTLPNGITFNASTNTFEGSATQTGTFNNLVVWAINSDNNYDEKVFSLTVNGSAQATTAWATFVDSLTAGLAAYGEGGNLSTNSYPDRLAVKRNARSFITANNNGTSPTGWLRGENDASKPEAFLNYGIVGRELASLATQSALDAEILPLKGQWGTVNLLLLGGANDICNAGKTAAQIKSYFDFIKTWCATNSVGFKLLTLTTLGDGLSTQNAWEKTVRAVNKLLRADSGYSANLIDIARYRDFHVPTIQIYGAQEILLDNGHSVIHLVPNGYSRLADVVDLGLRGQMAFPTITTTALPNGTKGQNYTAKLDATGGTGNKTFEILKGEGLLPSGLSIAADGTISGSPTDYGTFTITGLATDTLGATDEKTFTFNIANSAGGGVSFFDDFDRADGAIGNGWEDAGYGSPTGTITSHRLKIGGSGGTFRGFRRHVTAKNCKVCEIYLAGTGSGGKALMVRQQANGEAYFAYAANTGGYAQMGKITASGGLSKLAGNFSYALISGDTFCLDATNDVITMSFIRNGVETTIGQMTNADLNTAGYPGTLNTDLTDATIDEFKFYNNDAGVTPVNTPPTMSKIDDFTINEDTPSAVFPVTISDTEQSAASLQLTAVSNNPALIPNSSANIVFGGAGANRTLQIIPAANRFGTANVVISLSDGTNTTTQTVAVTVNSVNDVPTISAIANQTTTTTAPVTVNFLISDVETPAANLQVSAVSNNQTLFPNANLVLSGTGANRALQMTAATGQTGFADITISVFDGTATTTRVLSVTVNPSGGGDTQNPTISITSPVNNATARGNVLVQATAADNVAVANVTFAVNGIDAATDNSAPYSFTLNTANLTDGAHSITATATDTSNLKTTVGINIQVNNSAPASKVIQLDWDAPDPSVATSALPFAYRLMRSTSADFAQNPTTITLGDVLTHPDTVPANAGGYYYKIQSQNAGGWSVFSAPIYVPLV